MRLRITRPVMRASLLIVGAGLVLYLSHTRVTSQPATVRVALVVTPEDVLRPLLPDFEMQTGHRAEIVFTGQDPYAVARNGIADVVISHYGHPGVEPFVMEGFGLFPRTVFANQAVLLGPPSDPAQIRGLADAVEGFRRIAQTQSSFLVNNSSGIKYLEDILWEGAGRPEKGSWYIDMGLDRQQAVQAADQRGAYVLFGLVPFLRLQRQRPLNLEPLILNDPLFPRIMVSVVVNPDQVPGVNVEGAQALQTYLMAPATQARIRAFRYPGLDHQGWWPAGRHNSEAGVE